MKVRIAGLVNESVSDGPGLRIAVFFQGCKHHCPGCHNPQTWNFEGGEEVEFPELLSRIADTPLIRGVTLTGGDPFYQPQPALELAREFHLHGKDVWAYTGFLWEELKDLPDPFVQGLVRECDVVVDGPFIQPLAIPGLKYRGSSNQRLILVSETLRTGVVTEWISAFTNIS
jgi:anaerobic ribonucleoside-triphosphate reductase activating protein